MNYLLCLILLISAFSAQAQDSDKRFCALPQGLSSIQRPHLSDSAALAQLKQQEQALYEQHLQPNSSPKIYCGQTFRLANAELAALTQQIESQLGGDWQSQTVAQGQLLWHSKSNFWPKKTYSLLYQASADDSDTLIMHSFYLENSNSPLHSAVVFGVALSPVILMLWLITWLILRRLRRKQGKHTPQQLSP